MEASDEATSEEDVLAEEVLSEVPCGDIYLTDERYDRNLVDTLLNIDQELHDNETLLDVITPATTESLSPWALTVPNPKFIPHVPKKKHAKSADDSQHSYRPVLSTEIRYKERFRRSHETDIRTSSQYNHCVEPTTYRYVPNNGKYRLNKGSPQNTSPSLNLRRMKCLDKYISPEQRVVQREVQKSMKKEEQLQQELVKQQEESGKHNVLHEREKDPKEIEKRSDSIGSYSPTEVRESVKNEGLSDSTSKDTDRKTIQPKIHQTIDLPAMDIPLVGKQISQKFMEKFSRRINALDQEIKRDIRLLRRNPEDMMRSKSEPSRIMSQPMGDLRDVPKEAISDAKPSLIRHRRPEPITEDQVAQSYSSTLEKLETTYDTSGDKDVNSHQNTLFYKVGSKVDERQNDSVPSNSEFYKRNITPASDSGGISVQRHHAQPRRTMSFDQNMIQRAKLHRDFRLSSQAHSQYLKKVPESTTYGTSVSKPLTVFKPLKGKPKERTTSEAKASTVNNSSSAKHVTNGFSAVPLGKNRTKESEPEQLGQKLIPGVAGKRLQMSVVNHRLL